MLESPFKKVAGLQVFICEYCEIVQSSFFIEHLRWLFLQVFCFTLYFQKNIAEYIVVLHCIVVSFWNLKSLLFAFIRYATRFHSCHMLYHSLPFFITRCHSLSLVVSCLPLVVTRCTTRYHSLSFVVPVVVIRCHSLSFVVTRCTTRCHLLSLDVPFAATRCHSMYHSAVFL